MRLQVVITARALSVVLPLLLLLLHSTGASTSPTSSDGNVTRANLNTTTSGATSVTSSSSTSEVAAPRGNSSIGQSSAGNGTSAPSGNCEDCCSGEGDCSAVFRLTPGTCCGVIGGKPYCCPTASSSYGAAVRQCCSFFLGWFILRTL